MKKSAAAIDDRQGMFPIDLPPGPRLSSDEKARAGIARNCWNASWRQVASWSARLLGWQMRRFTALKQMLTPLDAAALTSRFESELERLGPAED